MNTYKWHYSFCIISICICSISILHLTHFELFQCALSQFVYFNLLLAWISIIFILCTKTVKDYWHIQGVGRERIAIVCNSHLLWISTRRFKIWGMIFTYIMRRRWCCLYQLPQTTWLGVCWCILNLGSWMLQQVNRGMQMHV